MTAQAPLHLGLFIYPGGHHIAGWRHPSVTPPDMLQLDYYRAAAQTAERGRFDLFFVGDMLAARERDGRVVAEGGLNNLDSISISAALSSLTERIGFVATLSTTYNEPLAIAARFAALDHISNGRAGWNIVTTANDDAAYNFGRNSHPEKTSRYARAAAFVETCKQRWDSRDDPAMPPLVQGWPVLVQAGGSPAGLAFAAQVAEVIFAAQANRDEARRFRSAMHAAMATHGRPPEALKILPGLSPILGSTEAEAERKSEELDALVLPAVGIWMLSEQLKFRLYDYSPDAALPVAEIRAAGSAFMPRVASLLDRAEAARLSIRACAAEVARSRSHGSFTGTPEQLADHMQLWHDGGACDGFNLMPAYFPAELELFVDHAVPVLQRRGLVRNEYEGTTLRAHLGLERPGRGGGGREL